MTHPVENDATAPSDLGWWPDACPCNEVPCIHTSTPLDPVEQYDAPVRVGFRYQDGEVLSPEREARSRDDELPEVVLDLGDGEWLTLAETRALPPAGEKPIRCATRCSQWPDCQHDWSAWGERAVERSDNDA